MKQRIGILLTNTGTPDRADAKSVRSFLREFLSDKRVVKIPRIIWLPVLYFLILPFRSGKSAALYRKIWQPDGSPMRVIMNKLAKKLQQQCGEDAVVVIGMNYGSPSIAEALQLLRSQQVERIVMLPLFPQYSNTTTASSFDRVMRALQQWPVLPSLNVQRDYASHPDYINAVAASIRQYWETHGQGEHLLISFHGLPKRFAEAGDPYPKQCEATASLIAHSLGLHDHQWTLCYQSQFGYDKWLQPSTHQLLIELPKRGIKTLDVVCPGFAIDCLETLEEIAERGAKDFAASGGKTLRMIPALNDSDAHADLLIRLTRTQPAG